MSVLTSSTRLRALDQLPRQLARRGGLARALQAGKQDDRRRLHAQVEARVRCPPMSATSSSWITPTSAWPGVRLPTDLGAQGLGLHVRR